MILIDEDDDDDEDEMYNWFELEIPSYVEDLIVCVSGSSCVSLILQLVNVVIMIVDRSDRSDIFFHINPFVFNKYMKKIFLSKIL